MSSTISGEKVTRPTKAQLAAGIAAMLGIENPAVSRGSSVDSRFLDEVHEALGHGINPGADAYRKVERVLEILGLTYDPYWDTSEAAPTGGGSTVSTRAYSRIRSALSGEARCFILNTTDAPVGAKYEQDPERTYGYDDRVTGRMPLNDAGPGSRVLFYSTSNSSQNKMTFSGHARIDYLSPGWDGPWVAHLAGYQAFERPVPKSEVSISGWNVQHAIREVTPATFDQILRRGQDDSGGLDDGRSRDEAGREGPSDPGGDVVAERVLEDFPDGRPYGSLGIPDVLPQGHLQGHAPEEPKYTADENTDPVGPNGPTSRQQDATTRHRDKLAEARAVKLVTTALEEDGWDLLQDMQSAGVGYDLLFGRVGRRLKVEVKGIQGSALEFNLTPKERWRAETDPEFVLVAVTSVLSPRRPTLNLLTRDRVLESRHVITGYRVTV